MSQYTIKIALNNLEGEQASQISDRLQIAYDAGTVAGYFSVELVGRTLALVTFERNAEQDATGVGVPLETVSVTWAIEQLKREFAVIGWSSDTHPACVLTKRIIDTLDSHDCTVAGLPCQKPRLRLFLEVAYETKEDRDRAAGMLTGQAMEAIMLDFMTPTLASRPTVLAGRVERDPVSHPSAQEVAPEPVRVVMDLTGGNIQWSASDGPVRLVVIDDDAKDSDSTSLVWCTDTEGVSTVAYQPELINESRDLVDHFFGQVDT